VHLVYVLFLHVGTLEHLFNRFHSLPEEIHVELLEFSPGKDLQEVISTLEILNLICRKHPVFWMKFIPLVELKTFSRCYKITYRNILSFG
jgi:hypothetical protein